MFKKVAYGVLVALVIGGGWWVKATYLEAGSALVTKYRSVDHAMRLNVQGEDLRVYEFTPQSAPQWSCIIVMGTQKGGHFCVPKTGMTNPAVPPNKETNK